MLTTVSGYNDKSRTATVSYISHECFSPNLKADIKYLGTAVDQNKYLLATGLLLGGAELAGVFAVGGAIEAVAAARPSVIELSATAGAGALSALSEPTLLGLGRAILEINTTNKAMTIESVKHVEKK